MSDRLTHIYTRTGDSGTTGLADGNRVDKDSPRIEALGTVDELNSLLGILVCHIEDSAHLEALATVQHRLFDLGGELAIPDTCAITEKQVAQLEHWLDDINNALPPLKDFILPGGNLAASHCHHARTVCRRAERTLLTLSRAEPVNPISLKFLNRLSDLLFVMARALARENGGQEVYWSPSRI